jgi:hypothetical protein
MPLGRHDHLLLHPAILVHRRVPVVVVVAALEHRVQVRVGQVRPQVEVGLPGAFQGVLPHRLLRSIRFEFIQSRVLLNSSVTKHT